ncbi:hypothetical protein EDD29_5573 [Actinocorallia herbida]|uniref:ABC-2 family transporter n=1 Tax=Actinocorallia herbida TaxID=58109 RepID=A0A3N1D318_9ACTN|nr:hypothetical protein [Actinocorallia herbida]ROO87925.1 hypothetical protein EDD29_5573 [Actinocorallia herbida]
MSSTTSGQHAVVPSRGSSPAVKYVLVGLFPFLMVVMMVGTMLTAMHQPGPNHMPLAVIASTNAQADLLSGQLTAATGEAFDLRTVGTEDEARELILKREVAGAYAGPSVRGKGQAALYVAGAAGASQMQTLTTVISGFAAAKGVVLQQEDIAPLPASDGAGVSTLYLTLGWILSGVLFVPVAGAVVPHLMRPRPFAIVAGGWAVFMGFAIWLTVGPIIGAIDGHPELIGLGALASYTGALFTVFFSRLLSPLGRLNPALAQIAAVPAIGLLVMMGVPASGGALSVWMEPSFFQWLHGVLPMPAVLETARSVLYFDARTLGGHLTTLLIWLFAFLILNFVPLTRRQPAHATAAEPRTALAPQPSSP